MLASIFNLNIKLKEHFCVIILIGFYIAEAYSKYFELVTGDYSVLSRVLKLIVLIILLIDITRSKNKKIIFFIFLLMCSFSIGQLFLIEKFSINSIITFGRYIFPLVLFFYFANTSLKTQSQFHKAFENIILFNSLCIFLGLIFNLELFKTYDGSRFGFNGLFLTSAASSYVYIIVLFYYYFKINKYKKIDWKIILIIASCFIVGTKALYLSLFVVSIYSTLVYFKGGKKHLFIALILAFSTVLGYVFFFQEGRINQVREYDGLITAILSYRDKLLVQDTLPYIHENWSLMNYFFGGASDFSLRSEMGFIDVFFFWGILGGVIYLYIYYKVYLNFTLNTTYKLFVSLIIIITLLAGNFFIYSTMPMYLFLLKDYYLKTHE